MYSALLAGAGLGLLSVPHCAAMCGPLAQAACAKSTQPSATLQYQVGRVVGYAFVGALSGHLGRALATAQIASWLPLLLALATSAALVMLAFRIYSATVVTDGPLVSLRTPTTGVSYWARVRSLLPQHPAAIGLSTAALPCGALAAALLVAATYGSPALGSAHMAAFAVTTAPGTLVVAWLLQKLPRLRSPGWLRATAVLLVALAALLVARPIHRWATQPPGTVTHSCH